MRPERRRRCLIAATLTTAALVLAGCKWEVRANSDARCSGATAQSSRDAKWQADLTCLKVTVQQRHPSPYERISRGEFERAVEDLERVVPQTSDAVLRTRLMVLAARLADASTRVLPDDRRLQVDIERFPEGLYVVGAPSNQQFLLGRRIVGIGNDSVDIARGRVATLVPAENADTFAAREVELLRSVDVLQGLGLAGNTGALNLVTEASAGGREETLVQPIPTANAPAIIGWPVELPRSLARRVQNYWYEIDVTRQTIYFQYNRAAARTDLAMATVARDIRTALGDGRAQRLVLDLRFNNAGSATVLQPLLDVIGDWPGRQDRARFKVLVGPRTSGGAFENAVHLSQRTQAEILGEPPGTNPNRFDAPALLRLPYSKQTLSVSTRRTRLTDDATNRLRLDRRIPWPVADYARGYDPVLAAAGL